jgi:hypothetical protein
LGHIGNHIAYSLRVIPVLLVLPAETIPPTSRGTSRRSVGVSSDSVGMDGETLRADRQPAVERSFFLIVPVVAAEIAV